jgi:5,10-methylene-tetrahydrofolate dehydrogenase/methenyl tetrahydrofolate cyclohydrolase
LIVPFPESSLNDEAGKMFMENYDQYAKAARVYCNVYAMKKAQTSSENQVLAKAPKKEEEIKEIVVAKEPMKDIKKDKVLGSLTMNHDSEEPKAITKASKPQGHPAIDKKKWMKRI